MRTFCATCSVVMLSFAATVAAQSTAGVAPLVIPVTGELMTPAGEPRTGTVLLAIALYDGRDDPAPRWIEYQTVALDSAGRYDVQFGSTSESGLPPELFTTSTGVRWLGVAVENEAEQPRMILLSVPYAAKAATADSLAGKPASDFVLATNLTDEVKAVLLREEERSAEGDGAMTNASNTLNYLQKGTGSGTEDSGVFETGGSVAIGHSSPSVKLDVRGTGVNDGGKMGIGNSNGSDFISFYGGQNNDARSILFWADGNDFAYGTASGVDGTGFSEKMRVTASGNVGIGHSSPSLKLDVRGTGVNDSAKMGIGNSNGSDFISFYGGQNNDARSILFWAAGNDFAYGTASAVDGTGFSEKMRVTTSGNVGIGTTTPSTMLHVAGNVTVDGNIGAKYQDVAEWVDAAEPLDVATLVVIDSLTTNRVRAAERPYDYRVAGAVSAQPGVVLGEPGAGRILIAQSGRVRVKADATHGAIQPGDLLVSSPTRGHVMRSTPIKINGQLIHRPGTVVGKALQALPEGRGEILVLLTLQ